MPDLRHIAGPKKTALLGARQLVAAHLSANLPKHGVERVPTGCEPRRPPVRRRSITRTGFVVTATAAIIGGALAGCSGSSFSTADWFKSKPSPPPVQTLQFQSEPPGADVHTAQGQTCQTPCSLAVLSENQWVTFAKNGFLPQTVQVRVGERAEHSLFSRSPAPALTPNPVGVALQTAVLPPEPVAKQESAQAFKHYWPTSAPMAPQPEASPSPTPQRQ